jgi:hypothetical protein
LNPRQARDGRFGWRCLGWSRSSISAHPRQSQLYI